MGAADAHERPIYACKFRVEFPILDADGDLVSGAGGLDSEIIKDAGSASDCTNEASEVAMGAGVYGLELTATEMSCKSAIVLIKTSTSGAKTTVLNLHTVRPIVLESGTTDGSGGGSGGSTSFIGNGHSAKDDAYNGLWLKITGGSNAGEVRRIVDYAGSTNTFTVEAGYTNSMGSGVTYEILALDAVTAAGWLGKRIADYDTAGVPAVDVVRINNDATAAANAEKFYEGAFLSGSVSDASPAAGDFDAATGLSSTDDFYVGSVVAFTSGTLKGIARKITGYTGSSRNFQFATAFPAAPADEDDFIIIGRID